MAYDNHRAFAIEKKRKLEDQGTIIAQTINLGNTLEHTFGTTSFIGQTNLFAGITFYFDGYTGCDDGMGRQELKESVLIRGGKVRDKLDSLVSHIIAARLTESKLQTITKPCVKPEWITLSIKSNTLLPWRHYQLNPPKNSIISFVSGRKEESTICADESQEILPSNDMDDVSFELQDEFNDFDSLHPPEMSEDICDKATNTWMKQNSSLSPDFIANYFNSSRLHHLSTWKNELKEFVLSHLSQKVPSKSRDYPKSVIMHVDMDCFFASVSLINKPELRYGPVAIAHSNNHSESSTSEIASCNYTARSFGIYNGMNLGKARGLCPILTVLPYDFEAYDKASRALYLTLVEFADDIQAVSCDEAFIDISSKIFDSNSIISEMLIESKAKIIAEKIRERVLDSTKCNVSIGIAENMLLARLATKFAKPNNLFFLKTQDTQSFINKLEISELPGIGRNIAAKLFDNLHITQCSELYLIQQGVLQSLLGEKKGLTLYQFARGIDRRILENKSRRSVGAEVNWGIRFEKESDMTVFLDGLCDEVVKRLNFIKCKSGAISIKLKKRSSDQKPLKLLGHGICDNFSKSINFLKATNSIEEIKRESNKLLAGLGIRAIDVRGIGVHLTKLESMTVTKSPGEPLESYQPLISSVLKRKKITRDPSAWISEKEFNIDMKVYNELPIDLQLELKHLVDLDTSKDSTHNKSSKMTIKSQVRSTKLNASESESVVIDFKAIFKGKHHITEWNTELNRILDMPFKEARLEFTDIRALLTRLLAVRMILEIELLLNLIIFKIDQFTDNDKVQGWTSQSLEWTNSLIQTFKLHYNSHPKELTNISKKLLSIQFTKRNESA